MLSGDNGILQKATIAKTETEKGQEQEIVSLAYNSALTKKISNGDATTVTADDLNTELTNQGATANGGNPIKVTFTNSKRQYNVYNDGIINFAGIKSDDEDNTDYAPYDNPYIPTNFSHTIGTWNTGFTIIGDEGTANEGDEFVWVPCVLEQLKVKSGDTVQTFRKITTGNYNTNSFPLHPSGGVNESVDTEDESVSDIRSSVGTYGGFYIAKYEAGISGTTSNANLPGDPYSDSDKTATDGSVKPLSQAGKGVWNEITRTNALTVSKAMIPPNTGCKSSLISGECWDTTLDWITSTADSEYAEVYSSEKGCYEDNIHTTGFYGANTNNIFDMAGNVREWTSENCVGNYGQNTIERGGCFLGSSNETVPPATRVCNYDFGYSGVTGFRVVIYK